MNIMLIFAACIPAVLFNFAYFLIDFTPMLSGWVSWGIINISFASGIIGSLPYWKTRDASRIGSQALMALYHQTVQLIVGTLLIVINHFGMISLGVTIFIHLLAAAIFIMIAASSHAANAHTQKVQKESAVSLHFSQMITDELRSAWANMPEGQIKKLTERVYDKARTMSKNPSVTKTDVDDIIIEELVLLKNAVSEADEQKITECCKNIAMMIDKRNMLVMRG